MTAGKILIVDDLPDWRTTLSGLLMDQGYEVQVASSVNGALRVLESGEFHVAVLDVRLDEADEDNRDGLRLMHLIKKKWPSIEIVILTGYADVPMAQDALNANIEGKRFAHSFLEKTQTNMLIKNVKQALKHSPQFLIAQGETERVEFKSSIRWDYKNKNASKSIKKVIAKTIAGMMNNTGGTLLIGVADNGRILGIQKDLETLHKSNIDGFELALVQMTENYLGLEYMKYLDIRFEEINNKEICLISIKPSLKPVFLMSGEKSEFCVRIKNSTRQLNVKEATEYIQEHWEK